MLKDKRYEGEGAGPAVESDRNGNSNESSNVGGSVPSCQQPLLPPTAAGIAGAAASAAANFQQKSQQQQQRPGFGFDVVPGASIAFFPGNLMAIGDVPISPPPTITSANTTTTITTKVGSNNFYSSMKNRYF